MYLYTYEYRERESLEESHPVEDVNPIHIYIFKCIYIYMYVFLYI